MQQKKQHETQQCHHTPQERNVKHAIRKEECHETCMTEADLEYTKFEQEIFQTHTAKNKSFC